MSRFMGLAGSAWRPKLLPPDLTPADIPDYDSGEISAIGPDGARTSQVPLAPLAEQRILIANRVTGVFQPGPSYANTDPQKGGAPGDPDGSTGITSQGPNGVTTPGGVPVSQLKLSMASQDIAPYWPTFLAGHTAINANANPNRPQVNPRPFNLEGPNQNTDYSTPAPWAAGTYIG